MNNMQRSTKEIVGTLHKAAAALSDRCQEWELARDLSTICEQLVSNASPSERFKATLYYGYCPVCFVEGEVVYVDSDHHGVCHED